MTKKVEERLRLTREAVLARAAEMADADGIESLSMRKLAQGLGVEAMSLYNHVRNRDDLLDGMSDIAAASIGWQPEGRDWRAEMAARGAAAHAMMMRHPWAALLVGTRANPGPAMLAYVDRTIGVLRGAGFDWPSADYVWNAMDSFILGFSLQRLKFPFAPEMHRAIAQQYLPDLSAEAFPNLHGMTVEVAEGRHDGIQRFDHVFGLVLDGLASLRTPPR